MSYIKKVSLIPAALCLVVSISSCSKEYLVEIYNFSGTSVEFVSPAIGAIEHLESTLMYDSLNSENVLFPAVVKIHFEEGIFCYSLGRINTGGYAEYDDSRNLVVRLKLEKDRKIYVYDVRESFNENSEVGSQPEHYPAKPEPCPQNIAS